MTTILALQHLGVSGAFRRARVGSVLALVLAGALSGCGGETKREEAQQSQGADQYELVIVDDGANADTATAAVRADSVAPTATDTGGVVRFVPDGAYTVQVAMYADAGQAAAEVHKLAASGYPAYAMARPDGRGVRVRIGYFTSRREADRFGRRFCDDTGAKYWVDRRANEED